MKKSDLKTGMRVETRNGQLYLVLRDIDSENYGHQDIAFVRDGGFQYGSDYRDDLTANLKEYDIVKVYNINSHDSSLLNRNILDLNMKYLIWEREEFPKLGDMYYYPSIDVNCGYEQTIFDDDSIDNNRKTRVGIYETKEEAIEKARELGWIK